MMNSALIADRNQSQLVVVDMQTKLSSVMPEGMAAVIKNCEILLQASALLEIPAILTEHYPKGLGPTLPQLTPYLNGKTPTEKITFSCCGEPAFNRLLSKDHGHVVLAGMEAHICLLLTALDLRAQGKTVFVIEDAIISRNPANKQNALNRMREAGIVISNTESVLFEWLRVAEGDVFKKISQLIR